MPTQGSVPSNFYFVQSRLPWNFRENAKEYIAMDKVVTPDQFPDEFATVYEKMKEIMIKGDVRGAPEPLTLEVAEARQRETGRSIKQNIMVAVMLFTVPTGCFAEMIDISTRTPVNGGDFTMFRFDLDWQLAIDKGTSVSDRIRANNASRDPKALMMMYSIWDTEAKSGAYNSMVPADSRITVSQ